MKNILVTGGAGFIGSHACLALHAAGFNPITYDNLIYGHRDAVQWGDFIHGDITDSAALSAVFRNYTIDAVIHFAAFAYVGESVTDPEKYYLNNVAGTLNLLQAMRAASCHRFIFSSSCATYGNPAQDLIDESHPQQPINPYGRSKLMVEHILADYATAYGFSAVALRYFNAAGSDPEARLGERHNPETHLIPLALGAALGTAPALQVFGNDYPTPDGTCVRDYIHVTDLADAHVRALNYAATQRGFDGINLGTEHGHSVMEVIETVARVTGRAVPHNIAPRRAGDPPVLVAKASKAREVLGWTPRYTALEDSIHHAYAFLNKA